MVKLTVDGPKACKYVLPASADVIAGYRHLHTHEEVFTRRAIEAVPEAVANWYGYLALFVELLKRGYECPEGDDDQTCTARMLRLHFAVAACGTSKVVLDMVMAGHYAQAYALMRHMLETWLQIVFLRLDSSVALSWMGDTADQHLHEPSYQRVLTGVKKLTKHKGEKVNIAVVERLINQLNKGAHPSRILLAQVRGNEPGLAWLGGNFDLSRLIEAMDLGTISTALLIHETGRLCDLDDAFWGRIDQLGLERNEWRTATSCPATDVEGS